MSVQTAPNNIVLSKYATDIKARLKVGSLSKRPVITAMSQNGSNETSIILKLNFV